MTAVTADATHPRGTPAPPPTANDAPPDVRAHHVPRTAPNDTAVPGAPMGSNPETPARAPRIAAFIDIENVAKHLRRHDETVSVERIRRQLTALGELNFLYAFVDVTRTDRALVDHILLDRTVRVMYCPKRRRGPALRDSVDERMVDTIKDFVDARSVEAIAIVTNDNDFADLMRHAKDRRLTVILGVGDPDASRELQRLADIVVYVGSPFLANVRRAAAAIERLQREPPAVADWEPAFLRLSGELPDAIGAFVEMIRYVDAWPHIRSGFAVKYLVDHMYANADANLPEVADSEEALHTGRALRELHAFVKPDTVATPVGDGPPTRLALNESHPLIAFSRAHREIVESYVDCVRERTPGGHEHGKHR